MFLALIVFHVHSELFAKPSSFVLQIKLFKKVLQEEKALQEIVQLVGKVTNHSLASI